MDNVKVYKANTAKMILWVVLYVIGIFYFLFFSSFGAIVSIIGAVCLIVAIISSLGSRNTYFELEGATLRYFKKKKLKNEWDLTTSSLKYVLGKKGSASFVINDGTKEYTVDVEFIKHDELFENIKALSGTQTLEFNSENENTNG